MRLSDFKLFILLFLFTLSLPYAGQAQPDGAALWKSNCATCHSTGDAVVIGPGMKGVETRHSEEWLLKWVKNSQALVKAGDETAVKLFEKYNKVQMPPFNLNDEEIKSLFAFAKAEAEKVPVVAVAAPGTDAAPAAEGGPSSSMILYTVLGILFILSFVLGRIKNDLKRVIRERKGEAAPEEVSYWNDAVKWMSGHKKIVALITLVLILGGLKQGWDALAGIGISQNYQPEQPIAFSHEIHAGQNGISCNYCHSGVEKSKNAGIPSVSTCMNCHKYIQEGPTTGKTEIAKIYAALDYDPATQTYGKNQKPIQWIKVHNLPDFAYFNHSQHVVAGKIECQTCHGPVEEMTVAKQYSPLTMGWCIDCHRTTEVQVEGNAYYDDFHKEFIEKHGKNERITVAKIGGLECAKCHY